MVQYSWIYRKHEYKSILVFMNVFKGNPWRTPDGWGTIVSQSLHWVQQRIRNLSMHYCFLFKFDLFLHADSSSVITPGTYHALSDEGWRLEWRCVWALWTLSTLKFTHISMEDVRRIIDGVSRIIDDSSDGCTTSHPRVVVMDVLHQ